MAKCPNYREKVVGRGFLTRGYYERSCTSCNREIEKEWAENYCKTEKYTGCSKYHGIAVGRSFPRS